MKATIALRCGINVKFYNEKYGTLLYPKLMNAVIALNHIHRIDIPKETAYKVNKEIESTDIDLKKQRILYDFIAETLTEHYGGDPQFKKIDKQLNINSLRFIINELAFCGFIKEDLTRDFTSLLYSITHDIRAIILELLILKPLDMLTILNLNLDVSTLTAYVSELYARRTVADDITASKQFVSYFLFS